LNNLLDGPDTGDSISHIRYKYNKIAF